MDQCNCSDSDVGSNAGDAAPDDAVPTVLNPLGSSIGKLSDVAKALVERLPLGTLTQLDELAADGIRIRRVRRLIAIANEAGRLANERTISPNALQDLMDHVGLPWLDNATLTEEEDLQGRWANLLLELSSPDSAHYDLGLTCVNILAELNPRDCEVLGWLVHRSATMDDAGDVPLSVVTPADLEDDLPSGTRFPGRNQLSIDKLVRLGCVVLVAGDSSAEQGRNWYGPALEVMPTLLGLNFYCAASGERIPLKPRG